MTQEQILKTYLEDDVFTENGYLNPGEHEDYEWNDRRRKPIIESLKILIKGEIEGEGETTSVRKANKLLSNQL